jgi:hypothetical protein
LAYNPEDTFKEGIKDFMFNVFGKDVRASNGFKLARALETNEKPFLSEHINEATLFLIISMVPPQWINTLMLVVVHFMPAKVKAAYMYVQKMLNLMYPQGTGGMNIVLVLYRFATIGTGSVLLNVYPFYELRLCGLLVHEVFLWVSEVGVCFINKMRVHWFKHDIKVDQTCCFKMEVEKVRNMVLSESRRSQSQETAAQVAARRAAFDAKMNAFGRDRNNLVKEQSSIQAEITIQESNEKNELDETKKRNIQARISILRDEKRIIDERISTLDAEVEKATEEEIKEKTIAFQSRIDHFKQQINYCLAGNCDEVNDELLKNTLNTLHTDAQVLGLTSLVQELDAWLKSIIPEVKASMKLFLLDAWEPIKKAYAHFQKDEVEDGRREVTNAALKVEELKRTLFNLNAILENTVNRFGLSDFFKNDSSTPDYNTVIDWFYRVEQLARRDKWGINDKIGNFFHTTYFPTSFNSIRIGSMQKNNKSDL